MSRKYDELCEELGIDPVGVAQQIAAVASKGMSSPDSAPPVQPHYSTGNYGHPGPGSMAINIEVCGCSGNLTITTADMKVELPSYITHALSAFFEKHEVEQEQPNQGEEV